MNPKFLEGVKRKLGFSDGKYPKASIDKYLLDVHANHDFSILKGIFH